MMTSKELPPHERNCIYYLGRSAQEFASYYLFKANGESKSVIEQEVCRRDERFQNEFYTLTENPFLLNANLDDALLNDRDNALVKNLEKTPWIEEGL